FRLAQWFTAGALLSFSALLALLQSTALAGDNDEERIEDCMRVPSISVMKYLKKQNVRNVGVLKFRVNKNNQRNPLDAGTINGALARMLENALIMRNDPEKPIGIVADASRVAAGHKEHATYLTPQGREKLFTYRYPLAWGKETIIPDLFLTGCVDLKSGAR